VKVRGNDSALFIKVSLTQKEKRERERKWGERDWREQSQTEINWIEGCRKISRGFECFKIGSEIFFFHLRFWQELTKDTKNVVLI